MNFMVERENPEVIDYLERENDYYQKSTAHLEPFQEKLYEEMKGRIKEDDNSVPYFYNGYWYLTRFETGKDYPIYSRFKDSLSAPEEILFDVNALAEGHDYYRLVGINISPDNTKALFGVDTVSRRQYVLKIKDLVTGEIKETGINNTTGGSVWAKDNLHFFYTQKDPVTLRSNAVFRQHIEQLDTTPRPYLKGRHLFFLCNHNKIRRLCDWCVQRVSANTVLWMRLRPRRRLS